MLEALFRYEAQAFSVYWVSKELTNRRTFVWFIHQFGHRGAGEYFTLWANYLRLGLYRRTNTGAFSGEFLGEYHSFLSEERMAMCCISSVQQSDRQNEDAPRLVASGCHSNASTRLPLGFLMPLLVKTKSRE